VSRATIAATHEGDPVTKIGDEHAAASMDAVRSVAQLNMLHHLAANLSALSEVEEIGAAITAELRTIIDYHNCRVYVLLPDGISLHPVAFRGELFSEYERETLEELATVMGEGITGHVAATRTSLLTPDAREVDFATQIPGTDDILESMLAVPMVAGDDLVGVIVLSSLGYGMFDDDDRRMLEVLASHAAIAIQKADLLNIEREASRRLRALDEMKNTFLEAVSHDLRTPLTSILGSALTLEQSWPDLSPDDARDLVRRVASNARKLERLLSDLLDLDRLQRGILTPQRRSTSMVALVNRVVSEVEHPDHGLTLDVADVTASVDAAKVERILENLVTNAIRHTPPGSHAWVRCSTEDGGVLLIVEDDGPGIAEPLWDEVFGPFRQAPGSSSGHSPGVGIGLSLVRRFAELHEGGPGSRRARAAAPRSECSFPQSRPAPPPSPYAARRCSTWWYATRRSSTAPAPRPSEGGSGWQAT